jgi:hypothetical protein
VQKPGKQGGRYHGPSRFTHHCTQCGAELTLRRTGKLPWPSSFFRLYLMPRAVKISKMPPCEGLPVGYEAPLG